ncbi:hypothetical protein ATN81_05330 [Agrobacterium pusense]|jgi:hypothetical protein|nr:hypothetical protein [Agrobacterium pusense]RRN67629.1 hypothetical protein EIQ31_22335 [Agrobacterium deltaense]HAU74833.1 hypothetical protein [Agrobacterium sp.]OJH50819.1 hypothetical protein ATN81_05330 [Agrobacterium pusense]OJH59896.1 hypothetical protein BA725_01590 [Agrobacterium pusense]WCK27076.1 hypothetical protein CFBP5496_0023070 [Agrobacterium pusense]
MDMENVRSWLGLVSLVISVGATIWLWLTSGAKKTASDLAEFRRQDAEEKKTMMAAITAIAQRTQALESDMKHLPDAKAVMEMRLSISELSGKIGRMEESQIGVARTVNRVEDFLLKGNAAA